MWPFLHVLAAISNHLLWWCSIKGHSNAPAPRLSFPVSTLCILCMVIVWVRNTSGESYWIWDRRCPFRTLPCHMPGLLHLCPYDKSSSWNTFPRPDISCSCRLVYQRLRFSYIFCEFSSLGCCVRRTDTAWDSWFLPSRSQEWTPVPCILKWGELTLK